MLTRQPISQFPLPANISTNWDAKTGTFRITGVTPGIYLLTAGVSHGREYLQASTMVTVGDADVTGIRLEPADDRAGRNGARGGRYRASHGRCFILRSSPSAQAMALRWIRTANSTSPTWSPDTYRVVPQINGPRGASGPSSKADAMCAMGWSRRKRAGAGRNRRHQPLRQYRGTVAPSRFRAAAGFGGPCCESPETNWCWRSRDSLPARARDSSNRT